MTPDSDAVANDRWDSLTDINAVLAIAAGIIAFFGLIIAIVALVGTFKGNTQQTIPSAGAPKKPGKISNEIPVSEGPRTSTSQFVSFDEPFESTLQDYDAVVQVKMGVAGAVDTPLADDISANYMPLRIAMLDMIGNEDPNYLMHRDGKLLLQQKLKKAVNQILVTKEASSQVDDVFFESFVIR